MTTVNKYLRFKRLIGTEVRYTVTVDAVHSDGTSSGTTRDGGKVRVLGDTIAIGNKAWVKDGRIVGEAPVLTEFVEYV